MAIYGRDYYGRTKYGANIQAEMAVDPFRGKAEGFDAVSLTWSEPGGTWAGFRLLRSTSGYPIIEDDGTLLLEFPVGYSGNTGKRFLDSDLQGGWYYYSIFLYNTGPAVWERAATVDVLVPYDYSSTDKLWDTIPDFYKQVLDDTAGLNQQKYRINPVIYIDNQQAAPNLILSKFLSVLGYGFDLIRTQVESVLDGYDIEAMHTNRLALLAEQFGTGVEESAPAHVNRNMVRNLGVMYRQRGTLDGIREMVSMVTGWDVDVTNGPNLMLSEDQANFINPEPQLWDPTIKYRAGDRVRSGLYLYQAVDQGGGAGPYGNSQAPNPTWTDNAYWNASVFVEPLPLTTGNDRGLIARSDTGDVSTWQIEGPSGFVSGGTYIGAASTDPEDGSINYTNSLGFSNQTATASADFTLRSIPRRATDLSSWSRRLVIENGIPVPAVGLVWDAVTRYRAGQIVKYKGARYKALGTVTGTLPSDTTKWQRMSYDDRPRLTLSWFTHGPRSGTVGTGGRRQHPVITEFDGTGNLIKETLCNPASYANIFFDPFNDVGTLTSGRVAAKGTWSANNLGTWAVNRDDNGGYAYPPATGRSYQLAPATTADGNVAVTYRYVPGSGRLMGVVFRWSDANNFWIATQTGVYKVVAGAARANPASGALTYATFVDGDRMRVELNGNTIKVYKNGALLGTATDSFNSTATRHGVEVEA